MKPRAQPCLRDYLTIHVPASTLMGDRFRKRQKSQQIKNPLMNQKLHNKQDIALIYNSLPNRSFGKKRKIQTIPLLSNLKINQDCKIRIVKNAKKAEYNFVIEKNKPKILSIQRNSKSNQYKRQIGTSQSQKSLPRFNLLSQSKPRDLTASLKFLPFQQKRMTSSTAFQMRSQQLLNKKIFMQPNMIISGQRVPFSLNIPYYKKQVGQENTIAFQKYSQSVFYIRHQ